MAIERVIGIDFGTSTSVIKVKTYRDGKPVNDRLFTEYVLFDGNVTVPTLVFESNSGNFLCGHEVNSRAEKGIMYSNFKIDLISKSEEKREKAEFLIRKFFNYLYKAYCDQKDFFFHEKPEGSNPYINENISEKTYVSYPAKWPQNVRELMVEIAGKAGFKNVSGYDEPTAAIHTVMVQEIDRIQSNRLLLPGESAYILMIDMGAGTTDLALCKYTLDENTKLEIPVTWPTADKETLLGGREIDNKLCDYTKHYLQRGGMQKLDSFESAQNLRNIKTWKEAVVSPALSQNQQAGEPGFLALLKEMLPYEFPDFTPIDRDIFEDLISDIIKQFSKLVKQCIEEGRKLDKGFNGAEDIDFVILTGGHSQWYFINDYLMGKPSFGNYERIYLPKIQAEPERLIKLSKPQETVALGLVYQLMNVDIQRCSANSVWVQFKIDDHKSSVQKVIDFGDMLPYKKEFTNIIDVKQSFFQSKNILRCVKYCGESIDTAISSSTSRIIPKGAFAQIIDVIFLPFSGTTDEKRFTIDFTIEVDTNQCAVINVKVSASGNTADPVKFTF